MIKFCKYCGQSFETDSKVKKYCDRIHYNTCELCGKTFELKDVHFPDRFCSKECRNIYSKEKREATTLARYGVKNAGWTVESQDKIKKHNLEKYGVEWSFQSEEVKSKIKQTCLERYGVENANQNEEIRKRTESTCLERYGDKCTLGKNSSLREHFAETNMQKYGSVDPGNLPQFKEKSKQTCLKKYGVEWYVQTDEYKQRLKTTSLERYGVEHPSKCESVKQKQRQTILDRYGVTSVLYVPEFRQKLVENNTSKYGVPWTCMRPECLAAQGSQPSRLNIEIGDQLIKQGTMISYEYHIGHKSYDIKLENTNILIEIDPTYTHTIYSTKLGGLKKSYHKDKSEIATSNGFRCIHIFDWDDKDKIIAMISSPFNILYARKCNIKEVSEYETNMFLNTYHLQNTCRGQLIRLGLYFDDELIQIMTFGQPRYNSKFEYELLRLCTRYDYRVVGGSERLFNCFIHQYNPYSIVSYCDNSKFSGEVYSRLGFELSDIGEPSIHWSKYGKQITDNLLRQRGFDQLFNTDYGKGTSNEELMLENGWLPVADCGQSRYEWRAK